MKILHIYKTYYPDSVGGCEQVIHQLAKATTAAGFKNSLLTVSKKPHQSYNSPFLQVIRCKLAFEKASCPFSIELFKTYRQHIEQADVLHYHFPWPFADLLHLIHRVKKPTVVTYHSDIVKQKFLKYLYQPVMKHFLSSVNKIIVTSQNNLTTSDDLYPFRDQCEIIPLGIDEEDYPKITEEKENFWRKEISQPFFLFVGVLRYYKGLHYLIKALQDSDIRLIIAGDGPERDSLQALAKQVNAKSITFLGRISNEDKMALIKQSLAVILPSHLRSEAFGISLVEGLMMGKPLISTELGTGTSFVNQHEKTGFVVPPTDPHALREAMLKLYRNDDVRITMGQNARHWYEQEFTAKRMGERYLQIYQNII